MSDILVVDDETDIRTLISDILIDEGFATRLAGTANEALEALEAEKPALVILDIWLKDSHMDGIDILMHIKSTMPDVPVVIISGHGNIEIAVAAIKQGAYDFIEKPFNLEHLLLVIGRAMEASALRGENTRLKVGPKPADVNFIGTSSKLKACLAEAAEAAQSRQPVLIKGPQGVGKSTIARYIHANRPQSNAGYHVVNCADHDSRHLSESLFGTENDTGGGNPEILSSITDQTIYLKNIDFASAEIKHKLMSFMSAQEKENTPIFFVASCSDNYKDDERNTSTRDELFSLFQVQVVAVPSLADRKADIPKLLEHFLSAFVKSHGYARAEFSNDAINALKDMPWVGNISEFRNFIEKVLIMVDSTQTVEANDIIYLNDQTVHAGEAQVLMSAAQELPMREARDLFEREYLAGQLKRFSGNISRTASFVGMERSALHRKMRKLNISPTDGDND